MPKLTKRIVEAASPKGRDTFLWCSELPGFGVRIFASGARSYLIQYRSGGRTRRVTIGVRTAASRRRRPAGKPAPSSAASPRAGIQPRSGPRTAAR